MGLFARNPADEHHKQGLRYRDIKRKEFNGALAVEHFQEAIKLEPDYYSHHFELGRTYLLLPEAAIVRGVNLPFKLSDSTHLALAEFEEVARLRPTWDSVYINMAHCYVILGDKKNAVSSFEQYLTVSRRKPDKADEYLQNLEYALLKRKKKHPDANPVKSEEHLRKGIQLRSIRKYAQADIELEKAREIAPDYRWFYERINRLTR